MINFFGSSFSNEIFCAFTLLPAQFSLQDIFVDENWCFWFLHAIFTFLIFAEIYFWKVFWAIWRKTNKILEFHPSISLALCFLEHFAKNAKPFFALYAKPSHDRYRHSFDNNENALAYETSLLNHNKQFSQMFVLSIRKHLLLNRSHESFPNWLKMIYSRENTTKIIHFINLEK